LRRAPRSRSSRSPRVRPRGGGRTRGLDRPRRSSVPIAVATVRPLRVAFSAQKFATTTVGRTSARRMLACPYPCGITPIAPSVRLTQVHEPPRRARSHGGSRRHQSSARSVARLRTSQIRRRSRSAPRVGDDCSLVPWVIVLTVIGRAARRSNPRPRVLASGARDCASSDLRYSFSYAWRAPGARCLRTPFSHAVLRAQTRKLRCSIVVACLSPRSTTWLVAPSRTREMPVCVSGTTALQSRDSLRCRP